MLPKLLKPVEKNERKKYIKRGKETSKNIENYKYLLVFDCFRLT